MSVGLRHGGRRANAGRPKVGRKVRAFRLSEAVSYLFDDLKAEGGYRRDEDFLAALLNRERYRLGIWPAFSFFLHVNDTISSVTRGRRPCAYPLISVLKS